MRGREDGHLAVLISRRTLVRVQPLATNIKDAYSKSFYLNCRTCLLSNDYNASCFIYGGYGIKVITPDCGSGNPGSIPSTHPIYCVQTRRWLSHYEGKLRGRTSTCRDGSRAICLRSSYVWSERWSEKPEVCWFNSDLRHHFDSLTH